MTYKITTNNVPRDIIDASQLSEEERKEFDYLDWKALEEGEDFASFFRYKGEIYDIGEIERAPNDLKSLGWHGYSSDTLFSGIVVKYVNEEEVVVGMYYVKD